MLAAPIASALSTNIHENGGQCSPASGMVAGAHREATASCTMLTRAVLSCGATRLMTMISPAIAIAPSAVNTSPLPTPPATPFGPASSTSPTNTTATASHAIGCWRLRKNSHWSSGASGT